METMKRVEESVVQQVHTLRYEHLNRSRRLFGGVLMAWIDEVAGLAAMRHSGCTVVTAAVDKLEFKESATMDDMLSMEGRLTYVGRSSMEVRVETWAEGLGAKRRLVNRAFVVMVALDEDGKPTSVPGLGPLSPEEQEEWARGERRHKLRKKRSAEHY